MGQKIKRPQRRGDIEVNFKRGDIFISLALIVILGFGVYVNSLKGQFVWDDDNLIKENTYIKKLETHPFLFTRSLSAGGDRIYSFYRPVQMITYMIDYRLWKLNASGYHLTNMLLHIAAALAVFWLVTLLYKEYLLSLFTSILFVVHPIHTEVVSYISGRADALAALFMLLCFIFYIKESHLWFTVLSYILALLSRENSLIVPAFLVLYSYNFKKGLKTKKFLAIVIITFVYILLRFTLLRHLLADAPPASSLVQRIPGFFAAIFNYIRLLLLPADLHMEYGIKLFAFANIKTLLGLLIFFFSIICGFLKRNNNLIFFSISWFFIALLPQSNLYPVNAYMAEHWLYLPSVGFFLILARGLGYMWGQKRLKAFAVIALMCLLCFYSYLTIRQNHYWRDPVSFYARTLKYAPASERVYNNLASIYSHSGRYEEVITLAKKAIALNQNYAGAYNSLGLAYNGLGRYDDAIAAFKKTLEINPNLAEGYSNLGMIYYKVEKNDEAIEAYKKALEIKPNFPIPYNNLGGLYARMGRYNEAIEVLNKAVELNPDYADAYNNLGNAYSNLGQKEKAVELYKRAVELNPGSGIAYYNLAVEYYKKQQYDLAVRYCDQALERGSNVPAEFLELIAPYRK